MMSWQTLRMSEIGTVPTSYFSNMINKTTRDFQLSTADARIHCWGGVGHKGALATSTTPVNIRSIFQMLYRWRPVISWQALLLSIASGPLLAMFFVSEVGGGNRSGYARLDFIRTPNHAASIY